jgi:hypothetical protein
MSTIGVVAIHEAGHAVVALVLGHAVIRASLDDRHVRTRYPRGDRDAHLHEAAIALAGPVAEIRYGSITPAEQLWRSCWSKDLANALRHVAVCGSDLPMRQATALVCLHWPAIMRVAAVLQRRGTLSGAEIDALMAARPMR